MNDKNTLRDDWEDRLAEQALGEVLGGKRPPDLSERILAAAQPIAAKRRPRARLALAASVLLSVGLAGGYAAYQKLYPFGSIEDGERFVASGQESRRSPRGPSNAPVRLDQVGGMDRRAPAISPRRKSPSQDAMKEKVALLVDEFNRLMDEHRYPEAEVIAKRAREVAPDEPIAKQISLMVKMVTRTRNVQDASDAKEERYRSGMMGMMDVDIAAIPFEDRKPYQFGPIKDWERLTKSRKQLGQNSARLDVASASGDPPILYPDPEVWQRFAERRKKYKTVDHDHGRAEQRLKQPISLNFRETALKKVAEEIGKLAQVEFRFDPQGLATEGIAPDTPISIELSQDVSVKSALHLILEPLHLGYVVDGGAVTITSETLADEGRGPGEGGDRYSRIVENPFLGAAENPLSTFSIDVDTASFAKVRRYLMQENMLPPPDAVRIEELVNYFSYDLPQPEGEAPFAAKLEAAACPWQPKHRLLRVSLKAREIAAEARPAANLVFLLDVSGSMEPDDKLPRVRRAMRLLAEQLREQDRVAIVVYAGSS
ncbi:MAG TPA: von Willebrand factor type A domain-containing protein, partial [Pirellulales bacterium]|nr:von Willebrand factor type A domain-containing protein [Pirellulales bacterium]